jgi:hypothetical protein
MKKSISTTGEHKYMQIAEGLEKMIAEDVLAHRR